jgi:hypothetical protein
VVEALSKVVTVGAAAVAGVPSDRTASAARVVAVVS